MGDKSSGGEFFAGMFIGALVGAAAALLFAPQSGEETRAQIREKGIEIQERSAEISEDARRRAEEFSAQTKDRAVELQAKMQDAMAEGKSAAGEQKEALLTELEQQEAEADA